MRPTTSCASAAPASTTSATSTSTSPATRWSRSPGSPGRASRRWPSARSTPRRSAATSSRWRRTRAGCCSRSALRTSRRSPGCRRRSRCSSVAARRGRARRSAPSPRCPTCCGCSTRGPATTRRGAAASRPRPSRPTPRPAPARAATAWGSCTTSPRSLLVPDPSLSIREGAIAAWPGAWQGANLRSIVTGLGIDVDRPWRRLRKKDRDWLLFTDEQPSVLIKPERDRIDYGYHGKFWSARKHVMHVLADSKSERMRERALRFVEDAPCPECHGSGLRPEALAVTFAGRSIAEVNELPLAEVAALLRPVADAPARRATRSRCGSAPTSSPGSRCCSTSAWATSASGAARRRCRPVRRSGCGSPPSCAPGCSGSSTSWTSPPRACTRPTRSRCSTCWTA